MIKAAPHLAFCTASQIRVDFFGGQTGDEQSTGVILPGCLLSQSPPSQELSFPGTFKVVCRTFDHFVGGMKHLYEVSSCRNASRAQQQHGAVRLYYIAAEEVEWDYASNKSSAPKIYNVSCNEERYTEQKVWRVWGTALLASRGKGLSILPRAEGF